MANTPNFGFYNTTNNTSYWYENGIRQGTMDDPKNVKDINGNPRGREIYDPGTDAWYWLDAVHGGAVAKNKEVWMPYVFQGEVPGSTGGKWVRYDKDGKMFKGWLVIRKYIRDVIKTALTGTDVYYQDRFNWEFIYYDKYTGGMSDTAKACGDAKTQGNWNRPANGKTTLNAADDAAFKQVAKGIVKLMIKDPDGNIKKIENRNIDVGGLR